jgi:hypothetical protein
MSNLKNTNKLTKRKKENKNMIIPIIGGLSISSITLLAIIQGFNPVVFLAGLTNQNPTINIDIETQEVANNNPEKEIKKGNIEPTSNNKPNNASNAIIKALDENNKSIDFSQFKSLPSKVNTITTDKDSFNIRLKNDGDLAKYLITFTNDPNGEKGVLVIEYKDKETKTKIYATKNLRDYDLTVQLRNLKEKVIEQPSFPLNSGKEGKPFSVELPKSFMDTEKTSIELILVKR